MVAMACIDELVGVGVEIQYLVDELLSMQLGLQYVIHVVVGRQHVGQKRDELIANVDVLTVDCQDIVRDLNRIVSVQKGANRFVFGDATKQNSYEFDDILHKLVVFRIVCLTVADRRG